MNKDFHAQPLLAREEFLSERKCVFYLYYINNNGINNRNSSSMLRRGCRLVIPLLQIWSENKVGQHHQGGRNRSRSYQEEQAS